MTVLNRAPAPPARRAFVAPPARRALVALVLAIFTSAASMPMAGDGHPAPLVAPVEKNGSAPTEGAPRRSLSEAQLCPPRKRGERRQLFAFPHLAKTGGTTLSALLYYTAACVECGSRESSGDKQARRSDGSCDPRYKLGLAESHQVAPEHEPSVRSQTATVIYMHASVRWHLSLPDAKLLILVRRTVPFRISMFMAGRGGAGERTGRGGAADERMTNFSAWIRSEEYQREALSSQLLYYEKLWGYQGSQDTVRRSGAIARLSPSALAGRLIDHPRVAWVGCIDAWAPSLMALEPVLGVPLLGAGIQMHFRLKGEARVPALTTQDYGHLATMEARESLWVEHLIRHVLYMAKQSPGPPPATEH